MSELPKDLVFISKALPFKGKRLFPFPGKMQSSTQVVWFQSETPWVLVARAVGSEVELGLTPGSGGFPASSLLF